MKKIWYGVIGIVVVLFLIGLFIPKDTSNTNGNQNDENNFDENKFNQLAIQSLHNNGFCYEGMETELGYSCGEADYPFIRVYGTEEFTEQGKILLVTQITEDLYEEFPSLYDKTITYVFRNLNQETIDTIYVKENKWDR
jgi:hypothetical protein